MNQKKKEKLIKKSKRNQSSLLTLLPLEQTLNTINNQSSTTKEVPKTKAPTSNTNGVNKEVNQSPVNNNKSQEDTKTTPLITSMDVQIGHVLGPILVRTILAIRS